MQSVGCLNARFRSVPQGCDQEDIATRSLAETIIAVVMFTRPSTLLIVVSGGSVRWAVA